MSEWISVEDRLPDEGDDVAVFWLGKDGERCVDIDVIEDGGWYHHDAHYELFIVVGGYGIGGDDCEVSGPSENAPYTHWVPLPAPPRLDNQGKGDA